MNLHFLLIYEEFHKQNSKCLDKVPSEYFKLFDYNNLWILKKRI